MHSAWDDITFQFFALLFSWFSSFFEVFKIKLTKFIVPDTEMCREMARGYVLYTLPQRVNWTIYEPIPNSIRFATGSVSFPNNNLQQCLCVQLALLTIMNWKAACVLFAQSADLPLGYKHSRQKFHVRHQFLPKAQASTIRGIAMINDMFLKLLIMRYTFYA